MHSSPIPFGRMREQDLCAQRRAVYPQKASWKPDHDKGMSQCNSPSKARIPEGTRHHTFKILGKICYMQSKF